MLSVKAEDVWVDAVEVDAKTTVKEVLPLFNQKRPVIVKKTGRVISERTAVRAQPNEPVSNFAVKVPAIHNEDPIFKAAQIMVSHEVNAVPVRNGGILTRENKYVTAKAVLGAIKSTRHLTKREARMIMHPISLVREDRLSNAPNIAANNRVTSVAVVNAKGKLVGVWHNGKVYRQPDLAKEGTRVKLLADKVLNHPVIVVDHQRNPVGVVDIPELLELAAMYREFSAPIFYSGFDVLAPATSEKVKTLIETTLRKISDMVPLIHSSVYLRKKGVWGLKVKVSTKWRAFIRFKESSDLMQLLEQVMEGLLEEVKVEKKQKTEARRILKSED